MAEKDAKTTVLEVEELQKVLGIKGFPGRCIARLAYRILELEKVNRVHDKYHDTVGPAFSGHVLDDIGVRYEIPLEQLERIPKEGGFITVSNHHYGAIDGMILNAVVGSRRPDYKILTTFFLSLIPSLKDSFIPVDNFSTGGARSISGIRVALGHIADGKALGLFPAGEVGTWQKKGKVVEDIPWAENIIKLIRKSGFPVIPIYFEGGNSKSFHILGKIHPRLRTVRLIHEVFNKRGKVVQVRIGQPIQADEIAGMDVPALGRYLRNRCYALEAQCLPPKEKTVQASEMAPLADPVPIGRIRAELDVLSDRMLFETGDYRAYLLKADEAPVTMQELYRLREETFRAVGEGTGKPLDTDAYDAYYRQMILWNIPNGEIVGAYRLGFGPEIMESYGVSGFYSSTLIRYEEKAAPLLAHSMELGRSFIVAKYQREVHTLRLLLAGLAASTLKCPELEYYSGLVSITNDLPDFYKGLITRYLEKCYPFPDAEEVAKPTTPFKPDCLSVDVDDLLQVLPERKIDLLDRFIGTLSDGKYRLPVLVRKYFSCNASEVCFNVDPDFGSCLDALIFLRFSDYPKATTHSILRGLPEDGQDAIWLRFYGVPRP